MTSSRNPRDHGGPAASPRARWCSLLASILLVWPCSSAPGAEPLAEELVVERVDIELGREERQTVLTGFLLGRERADVVVLVGEQGEPRLRLYGWENGGWRLEIEMVLLPEVSFADVVGVAGRDRLVFYSEGELRWLDPGTKTLEPLVSVRSGFVPPRRDEIPHVDITRDLDGDGRDDLVLPNGDGFEVLVQAENGTFAAPLRLGPPVDLSGILGADGYRYDPWRVSRIEEVDLDRDGRRDLVYWKEDHFEAHLQTAGGSFDPEARIFGSDVAFDSDDVYSLAEGDMEGTALYGLADLNADGAVDLVLYSLIGEKVSDKRSRFEVHFGEPEPGGGLRFAERAELAFSAPDRLQLGMRRLPGRGGSVDLAFTTIERRFLSGSPWKKLKGAMGDDVWLELEVYRGRDGRFGDRPGATHRLALDGVPSPREPGWVPLEVVLQGATHEDKVARSEWSRAFNRTLLLGDVTGDGLVDLLIEPEFRELLVFAGVSGPEVFARQPKRLSVVLPRDVEYAWLVDLDRDGKQDILLHETAPARDPHGAPSWPPGEEPQRLTLLLPR